MLDIIDGVDPILSDQYTNRVAIAGTPKRHVGLPVGEAVVSLIDQNPRERLSLRLVRRDGITERERELPTHDGQALGTGRFKVERNARDDERGVRLAEAPRAVGVGLDQRHLDRFVRSTTAVGDTAAPDFLKVRNGRLAVTTAAPRLTSI